MDFPAVYLDGERFVEDVDASRLFGPGCTDSILLFSLMSCSVVFVGRRMIGV